MFLGVEWEAGAQYCILLLVELCEELDVPDNGEFVSHKDNCNVVIGWMPIEKLKEITIYPEFLKEEIYRLDAPMKHFVSRG